MEKTTPTKNKPDYTETDKFRFYLVYTLLRDTDENNPMTINQIVEALHGGEFKAERKSVSKDIQILKKIGEAEWFHIQRHKDNKKGVYMSRRKYEDREITLLINAATATSGYSDTEKIHLIEKLEKEYSPSGKDAYDKRKMEKTKT